MRKESFEGYPETGRLRCVWEFSIEWLQLHGNLVLLLLLSRFSRVRLSATPQTAAHQVPPVPGILQARTLEWVAISSSNA